MRLYISHIDANVTHSQLAAIFLWYGELEYIEIIPHETRNAVYIKYSNLYNNYRNHVLQQELTDNSNIARVYYNEQEYWMVAKI
jgi:hypothetical protein